MSNKAEDVYREAMELSDEEQEKLRKMLGILEACGVGYFGHGPGPLRQKLGGAFEAFHPDKLGRRALRQRAQTPLEVPRTQAHVPGQGFHPEAAVAEPRVYGGAHTIQKGFIG